MVAYERLKTVRAVAKNYTPHRGDESWHVLRYKLRHAERTLKTVAELVDEYEVTIGVLPPETEDP